MIPRLALPLSHPEPSFRTYGICNRRIRDEMMKWG